MPTFNPNGSGSTGSLQTYIVPKRGIYRLRAVGAAGGQGWNGDLGGLGADMAGDFELQAGDEIRILVGQRPPQYSSAYANGGGGGTFITLLSGGNYTPLVVAGGGNGSTNGGAGQNATTTNNGTGAGSGNASGAGWSVNGNGDSWVTGTAVAYSFLNGGKGGGPGSYSNYGGYGGGAATHGNTGTPYPGGGGYSGGSPGSYGGGSYNAGENQANSIFGTHQSGFAVIDLIRLLDVGRRGYGAEIKGRVGRGLLTY